MTFPPMDAQVADLEASQPAIEQIIADAVLAVPGVGGLSGGAFDSLATYLPTGRLLGVRRFRGRTEIAIVLQWGASADITAARVRARVRVLVEDPVDIEIADITVPELRQAGS